LVLTAVIAMAGASVILPSAASAATPGAVTQYPLPDGSGPGKTLVGPDNNLWFTESGPAGSAFRVSQITTSGVVTGSLPLPPNGDVTTGPDGNFWFTDPNPNAGQIGRMTLTGAVTEYPTLTYNAGPARITAGPDGNLWFTEPVVQRVGRITPAGIITEFPASSSSPGAITSGPDGNLWFLNADAIDRITTTGVVTQFSQGITPGSRPVAITSGPDGNLWFTEWDTKNGNRIGRVTPTGVVTEFSAGITPGAPDAGVGLEDITAGPDGSLWFTEHWNQLIGRITSDGVITQSAALGYQPDDITAGPDGNVWFTETSFSLSAAIGVITPGSLPNVYVPEVPAPALLLVTGTGVLGASYWLRRRRTRPA
jgi:virginiamycin B lyase